MENEKHEHERWHKRLLILAALLRSIGKPHLRDAADVLHELATDLAAGEDDATALIGLVETFTCAAMNGARMADLRWVQVKRNAEGVVSDE